MDSNVKCARLTLDPYGSILYVSTSRKVFLRRYKKLGGKKLDAERCDEVQGFCVEFGNVYLIGIFSGGIDTMVHELTHVCMYEAVRTNFHCDNSNDEALAYLMGTTAGKIVAAFPELLEKK